MSDEKKIDDGGPAFPQVQDNYVGYPDRGMSLRDYFAAAVSPQEIEWSAPDTAAGCRKFLGMAEDALWDGSRYGEVCSIIKYRIADAMLAARNKHHTG
jgi:hypothetical protein